MLYVAELDIKGNNAINMHKFSSKPSDKDAATVFVFVANPPEEIQ